MNKPTTEPGEWYRMTWLLVPGSNLPRTPEMSAPITRSASGMGGDNIHHGFPPADIPTRRLVAVAASGCGGSELRLPELSPPSTSAFSLLNLPMDLRSTGRSRPCPVAVVTL
jgi:hypothetical protein